MAERNRGLDFLRGFAGIEDPEKEFKRKLRQQKLLLELERESALELQEQKLQAQTEGLKKFAGDRHTTPEDIVSLVGSALQQQGVSPIQEGVLPLEEFLAQAPQTGGFGEFSDIRARSIEEFLQSQEPKGFSAAADKILGGDLSGIPTAQQDIVPVPTRNILDDLQRAAGQQVGLGRTPLITNEPTPVTQAAPPFLLSPTQFGEFASNVQAGRGGFELGVKPKKSPFGAISLNDQISIATEDSKVAFFNNLEKTNVPKPNLLIEDPAKAERARPADTAAFTKLNLGQRISTSTESSVKKFFATLNSTGVQEPNLLVQAKSKIAATPTQERQLDQIQAIDVVIAGFDDLEGILKSENVGISGKFRNTIFGLRQQSEAFKGFFDKLQVQTQEDAAGNFAKPDKSKFNPNSPIFDVNKLFDPQLNEQDALANILAYRLARSLDPTGRLSDADVENARRVIGIEQWLTGTGSVKARFNAIRRQLGRERGAAEKRLGRDVELFVDPTILDGTEEPPPAAPQPTAQPATSKTGKRNKQQLGSAFGITLE